MWYLIGVVAVVLIGFFVYANMKSRKCQCGHSHPDNKPFRTDEDLNSYKKPLEDSHSASVDMDDAE